ncbi:adenine nucleotide transporter BT1 [Forsythia ovata]|uniref:Adenine nucleotide transporter BT1 n=1 Tax=Forsythia ovata TaxID=205694 RepID=A0ABD1WI46_9LAMI
MESPGLQLLSRWWAICLLGQMDNNENGCFMFPCVDLFVKYVSSPVRFKILGVQEEEKEEVKKKKDGLRLKVKIENPSLRRLISGAIAGGGFNDCRGSIRDDK